MSAAAVAFLALFIVAGVALYYTLYKLGYANGKEDAREEETVEVKGFSDE